MFLDWSSYSNVQSFTGIAVAALLFYYAKKRFFTSSKWRSPFSEDSRIPLTPLETDKAKRDEILKRAFTKQLANEKKWDAIVIGSGIGGLSTAALLSKAGMKVLVLEKHYKCGGACHTFIEEGYEFDVGIHYVGNFIRPTLTRTLIEQITDGQIQWAQLDNCFDRVIMDAESPTQREFDISSGKDAWKDKLIKLFLSEKKAIESFFSMLKRAYNPVGYSVWMALKIMPLWLVKVICFFRLPWLLDFTVLGELSIKEVVKNLTDNRDLQFLLVYASGGYGVASDRTSISMAALLHVHCCEYGSCYPVGGASEIPYRIVPVIERSGGRVLMRAHVSQILTEKGKVIGVRVGTKENSAVDILAPIVISDTGLQNTFQDLLPENVAKLSPSMPLVNSMPAALGNLTVFIGLKGTPEELGLTAQNIWIFTDCHPMENFQEPECEETLQKYLDSSYPALFLSSASSKDPSWEKRYPDRSTISVVSFISYSFFSKWSRLKAKKRGDEYNTLKNAIGLRIIDQVTRQYPKIKNAIDYFSVATPVTIEYYLNTKKGGTYGLEHDMERFSPEKGSLLRPDSGIEGLFFSGQDVISCGFAATLLSGLLCAGSVLKRNYTLVYDLFALHTRLFGWPKTPDSLFF